MNKLLTFATMILIGILIFGFTYSLLSDKATQLTVAQQGLVIAEANAAFTRAQAIALQQEAYNAQMLVANQIFTQNLQSLTVMILVIGLIGTILSVSLTPIFLLGLYLLHRNKKREPMFLPVYHQYFLEGRLGNIIIPDKERVYDDSR